MCLGGGHCLSGFNLLPVSTGIQAGVGYVRKEKIIFPLTSRFLAETPVIKTQIKWRKINLITSVPEEPPQRYETQRTDQSRQFLYLLDSETIICEGLI